MNTRNWILTLSASMILIGVGLNASGLSKDYLDGLCKGRCVSRYTTGFVLNGRCWCADLASPDPREPTTMPHRHKDSFNTPEVYYGEHQPHIPLADTDF